MMNKIIVITGCSKVDGIGYQLACDLLKRGYHVIATVRDVQSCQSIFEAMPTANLLDVKQLDLCDHDSIDCFSKEVLEQYGYIDVLVNNAANVAYGPVETLSQEDMQITFQTKVFGPVALIQKFLPRMRERKAGLLLTASSIFTANPIGLQGFSAYMSALNAFDTIQKSLAIELKPWNIRVVNFQPGPVRTSLSKFKGSKTAAFTDVYEGFLEAAYSWVYENIPYNTAAEVSKVYANIIELEQVSLGIQYDEFGEKFMKRYMSDPSMQTYLEEYLEHFTRHTTKKDSAWKC